MLNAAVRQRHRFWDSGLTSQVPRSRNRALPCACVRRGPCCAVFQQGGCDLSIFACRTIMLLVSIFNPSAGQKCAWECSGSGAAPARPGPGSRRQLGESLAPFWGRWRGARLCWDGLPAPGGSGGGGRSRDVASSIPLFLPFPSLGKGGSGVLPALRCSSR